MSQTGRKMFEAGLACMTMTIPANWSRRACAKPCFNQSMATELRARNSAPVSSPPP
jgi:hypothetical protein